MKNEIDEFLGDLGTTEADPFAPSEEEIPGFGEQEATVVEKTEPKEEKPEPFHKNPKFKKLVEQNRELSEKLEKLSESEKFSRESASGDSELSGVLTRIIGNDTPEKIAAVKDFEKALSGMKDKARDEALDYFREQQAEAKRAEKEADTALDDAFDSIEERYGVDITSDAPLARKTRAEFVDFVKRIAPKDSEGNVTEYPDLSESFDVFQKYGKAAPATASNARAKEIASRSMARSTETSSSKPAKRITWDTVQSDLDRLTG